MVIETTAALFAEVFMHKREVIDIADYRFVVMQDEDGVYVANCINAPVLQCLAKTRDDIVHKMHEAVMDRMAYVLCETSERWVHC